MTRLKTAMKRKRLESWGFLNEIKSKANTTHTMTQFKGSMQNCTTFERIKKIVSMNALDLNLLGKQG